MSKVRVTVDIEYWGDIKPAMLAEAHEVVANAVAKGFGTQSGIAHRAKSWDMDVKDISDPPEELGVEGVGVRAAGAIRALLRSWSKSLGPAQVTKIAQVIDQCVLERAEAAALEEPVALGVGVTATTRSEETMSEERWKNAAVCFLMDRTYSMMEKDTDREKLRVVFRDAVSKITTRAREQIGPLELGDEVWKDMVVPHEDSDCPECGGCTEKEHKHPGMCECKKTDELPHSMDKAVVITMGLAQDWTNGRIGSKHFKEGMREVFEAFSKPISKDFLQVPMHVIDAWRDEEITNNDLINQIKKELRKEA